MGARFRSWWWQIKTHLVSTILIALLAVVILLVIFGGYKYNWDWTGFNRPSKTLWDWLQLLGVLAVPVVVGFGAVWFTTRQTRISEENRKQQHDTELQIAEIQQQEELLRTYFDKISDLLLDKELSTNPNIQSIVRARTLAALHILNTERKAIVLRFLHDSGLLQYVKDFLYTLDLNHADLYRIDLSRANLNYTNLRGADLSGADLSRADFFTTVALCRRATFLKPVWEQNWLEGSARRGVGLKRGSHLFKASNRQMHGLAQPIGVVLPIDASIGHPTGAAFGA